MSVLVEAFGSSPVHVPLSQRGRTPPDGATKKPRLA